MRFHEILHLERSDRIDQFVPWTPQVNSFHLIDALTLAPNECPQSLFFSKNIVYLMIPCNCFNPSPKCWLTCIILPAKWYSPTSYFRILPWTYTRQQLLLEDDNNWKYKLNSPDCSLARFFFFFFRSPFPSLRISSKCQLENANWSRASLIIILCVLVSVCACPLVFLLLHTF